MTDALMMAIWRRGKPDALLHHSDQGKAHARQMYHSSRKEWRTVLNADRRGTIDAPHWLWESVVSLAGSHEVGYLEHCRRYAMAA